MKKWLVGFLLVSASLASAAPITCADQPGRRFCGKINRFAGSLTDCEGTACEVMWRDQIAQIRVFLDEYYDTFLPGDEVGKDLGALSQKTARQLCRVKVTGSPTWVSALTVRYNQFLKALKQLQEMAELETPYSCTFTET